MKKSRDKEMGIDYRTNEREYLYLLSCWINKTIDDIIYSFEPITHLIGEDPKSYEDGLYFYHGSHLSSTQLIMDMYGAVSQAVLFCPFGQIISEYRADWMLDTLPRYLFCGHERDAESGLDYMKARYYNSKYGTFEGRDLLFEKYFWMSPYAYCANNPVKYIDPSGDSIVGTNGKPVSYNSKTGWSRNASDDVKTIGNAMMRTKNGTATLKAMLAKEYPITIKIVEGKSAKDPEKLGNAQINSEGKKEKVITSVNIEFYKEKMIEKVNDYGKLHSGEAKWEDDYTPTEKNLKYLELVPTLEDMYTTYGTHEGTHATKRNAMSTFVGKDKAEQEAIKQEIISVQELIDAKQ